MEIIKPRSQQRSSSLDGSSTASQPARPKSTTWTSWHLSWGGDFSSHGIGVSSRFLYHFLFSISFSPLSFFSFLFYFQFVYVCVCVCEKQSIAMASNK
jgi:hypothetical protein